MANKTTEIPLIGDDGWSSLWSYGVYFIQGGVVAASNLLIVLTVLRHEALRASKEYVLMMGLSLADACNMAGYCIAGFHRSMLVLTEAHSSFVTAWQCMTSVQNLIWSFTEHLSGLILLVVSLDRILMVSMPVRYCSWTRTYVIWMISGAFIYTLVTGTVSYVLLVLWVDDNTPQPAMCFSGAALVGLPWAYQMYYQYACPTFAFLSIVVYGVVWVLYVKHMKVTPGNSRHGRQENKQKRLTTSLGISSVCTLFIFMIPYCIGYISYSKGAPTFFVMSMYIISNFNPLCNVFIYSMRHQEMKKGIKALLAWKTMPGNIDLWATNRHIETKRSMGVGRNRNNILVADHKENE